MPLSPDSHPPPSPPPRYLYKILLPSDIPSSFPLPAFTSSTSDGPLPSSIPLPSTPLDISDAFIHLSTSPQLSFVLSKFYSKDSDAKVYLFKIDHEKLLQQTPQQVKKEGLEREGGEDEVEVKEAVVKWEEAGKDGMVFAHVYGGDILGESVVGVRELQRGQGWGEVLRGLDGEGWLV